MDEPKTPAAPGETAERPAKGPETMALLERAIDGDESCQEQLNALMDDPERGPRKSSSSSATCRRYAESDRHRRGGGGEPPRSRRRSSGRWTGSGRSWPGRTPTPIERLLAERAAYCWLVLWRYEEHLANAKDLTSKRAEFHHRRIDAAHRRYLSSLRTLATVRKLALPAVQVNIGQNQVNVAGET